MVWGAVPLTCKLVGWKRQTAFAGRLLQLGVSVAFRLNIGVTVIAKDATPPCPVAALELEAKSKKSPEGWTTADVDEVKLALPLYTAVKLYAGYVTVPVV